MKPEQGLPSKQSSKVTDRINATSCELLEKNPEGLRWTDLRKKIEASDDSFHPKTVNRCVWKLAEKSPDKVTNLLEGCFACGSTSPPKVNVPDGTRASMVLLLSLEELVDRTRSDAVE